MLCRTLLFSYPVSAALLVASAALAAPPPAAPTSAPTSSQSSTQQQQRTKAHSTTAAASVQPRGSTRGYRSTVSQWHAPPSERAVAKDEQGRPMLVLFAINTGERAELRAETDEGGFSADALDRAAHLLRDPRTKLEHPVEPALLDLVYRAQVHFGAQEVRVISGYRVPTGKSRSNHGRGRAMDIIIPGVADTELAAWARGLGFTGVGLYPTSGFCHLDVRNQSYFWVDRSGPGQRKREVSVLGGLAQHSDTKAQSQSKHAVPPFATPLPSVDNIWRNRSLSAPSQDNDSEGADEDNGS